MKETVPDGTSEDPGGIESPTPGAAIVNASWAGTGVFTASATIATIDPDRFGRPSAVVSLILFGIGCGAFLWAYALAVSRSRTDAIGIGGLYFLAGSAPALIRRRLLLSLAVEVVVALVTSSIRVYSAVAFGVLVPMYGLGLCGLWGARYGQFPPRSAAQDRGTSGGDESSGEDLDR